MIDLREAEASARRAALTGATFALAAAFFYGINIVYARMSSQLGVGGSDIVVYRALLFGPLMGLFLAARGRSLLPAFPDRLAVFRFATAAAATALFYLTALRYLPVAMTVTLFYTYPLIVLLLTPYIDRVRLPMRRWICGAVAFAGVALAVGPHLDGLDLRGVVFALLGSISCAAMFINGSRLTGDSLVTFFWCQIVAAIGSLVFAAFSGSLLPPAALVHAALPLAITIGCYFFGFIFQLAAASRVSAATAGLLFLMEPVTAILGSAALLNEPITLVQGAGMLLVAGALVADMAPGLATRPAPPAAP